MDPVGVISLIYDLSKDIYAYYVAVKKCDPEIKELRTQLLSLQRTSIAVANALKRDGVRAEDKTQAEEAVSQCEEATAKLKSALDSIRLDGAHPQKALEKVKALGRKAVYPFKIPTIASLREEVETCQDALHVAASILQLNVSGTTVEQLHELDTKLEAGTTKLETAFSDLEKSNNVANNEIIQQLLRQRKLLTDETQERKALAVVDSLKYPEMLDRMYAVPEADETSLGWLFTDESRGYPELQDLMTFLNQESGLFWIQGKPASGKSTFLKYLFNRGHGRDKLWSWTGNREVVNASHFCWIAGGPMQKSQQGLLRTLLHQILSSDLALVPIACPSQWDTGGSYGSWYVKELWDCLYAAVCASDKRICFFIDGLDEIEPEKDHAILSNAIARLSLYENVKVVTSSRPWPAFERILRHDQRWMTMENINHRSIVKYIRSELEANAECETFAHVDWNCITSFDWNSCKAEHQHNDAHILVETVAGKADGVFLWVALVMEAVCKHLILDCPVRVLRSYVDAFPHKLEEYFRTMIFKRIHDSLISETAMVLWIALIRDCSLSHLALLCQYTDSGVSWLMQADFCSALPCSTCGSAELEKIVKRTKKYVEGCCRDILSSNVNPPNGGCVTTADWYSQSIHFTHRTIFDFLHTPDMQSLLERHIPEHFMDDSFENQLLIASRKMATIVDKHSTDLRECWDGLVFAIRWQDVDEYMELATIAEQVSIYQFDANAEVVALRGSSTYRWCIVDTCTDLCIELSTYGLFSFTDSVLRTAPYLLTRSTHVLSALNGSDFLVGHHRQSDVRVLRRFLQAGIDINDVDARYYNRSIWSAFLEQLRSNTRLASESEGSPAKMLTNERLHNSADIDGNTFSEDMFSNPDVQDAVKLFIEHGADLMAEDIEMLIHRMPKTMIDGREWSGFLLTHAHPDKRKELREDRRTRIRNWNQRFWSESDRTLLGLPPRRRSPLGLLFGC